MKLKGWRRLWVVAVALWTIPVGVFDTTVLAASAYGALFNPSRRQMRWTRSMLTGQPASRTFTAIRR